MAQLAAVVTTWEVAEICKCVAEVAATWECAVVALDTCVEAMTWMNVLKTTKETDTMTETKVRRRIDTERQSLQRAKRNKSGEKDMWCLAI
jgi:hypothetical protein